MRIDRFIALRHITFFNKISHLNIPKFASILAEHPSGNRTYPKIDLLHQMHLNGQLTINDKFLLFHNRYNGAPGTVYSISQ